MPRDNFTMSESSDSFGMQQRQDRFDAIGDLIVGPPGPPGPQGPPGADGTVSFDELTPAQRESLRGEGVPAGGTTGQVLAKSSNADYETEWVDQSGGGGGTSNYNDLSNKPSINGNTLSGNKTAAQLGLAAASDIPTVPVQSVNGKTGAVVLSASDVGAGTYSKPSGGIPASDLASAVQSKLDNTVVISTTQPTATENKLWVDTDAGAGSTYQIPTVAEMEAADAQLAAEIGIVITGKRPSMAVTAGQFVIVRNSTISRISDGLYTANAALSPSTDVTAANLTAVSGGGLNNITLRSDAVPTILEQSFTSYSSVNKMGHIAVCTIDLQNGNYAITSGGWYNIATIPNGFLPDNTAGYSNIGLTQNSSNVAAMRLFQIQSNGNVRVSIISGTYTRLYCNIVYFCK